MKHLKWMSFMLALTVCLFTFTACGDDDEDNGNNDEQLATVLVGTWTAYEMDILGITVPLEYDADDSTGYMELVFEANKKGTMVLWTDDGVVREPFSYTTSGKQVILNGDTDSPLVYDDAAQSLTWHKTMIDQYGQSATYRFKKR